MTAEVSVMNSLGVALAADSAVTLGGSGKIYSSADKLFELSRYEPLGIMLFGNAHLLGVPWETLVKMYRSHLGRTRFPTVRQYADHFVTYLQANKRLFPEELRGSYVSAYAKSLLSVLFQRTKDALDAEIKKSGPLDANAVQTIVDREARIFQKRIHEGKLIEGCPKTFIQTVRRRYSNEVNEVVANTFGKLPMSQATRRGIRSAAFEALVRCFQTEIRSGIVIAGFGTDQHFPGLIEIGTDGITASRLRYEIIDDRVIEGSGDSTVKAFAQSDMVSTFMSGLDNHLYTMMGSSTEKLFRGFAGRVFDEVKKIDRKAGAALESQLSSEIGNLLIGLAKGWTEERERSYIQPVMNNVSALPKDELGAMAEALVNLTKFKRRISAEQETVGGPIDVAVISKGDGFVWIRRKHYFEPRLNPRYFSRQTN